MQDNLAGLENAGLEFAGLENAGQLCRTGKRKTKTGESRNEPQTSQLVSHSITSCI